MMTRIWSVILVNRIWFNISQTGVTIHWILMFQLQFPLLDRKFKAFLVTEITLWLLSKQNVAYKKTAKGW